MADNRESLAAENAELVGAVMRMAVKLRDQMPEDHIEIARQMRRSGLRSLSARTGSWLFTHAAALDFVDAVDASLKAMPELRDQ